MLGFRNQPRRETAPLVALAKPHGLKGTEPRARGPVGVTTPLLVCLLCTGTECCAVRLGLSSNVFRMHLVAQKHRFLKEDLVFLFQRRFSWALFINCRSQTPAAETAASFRFTVSLWATARRPPPSPGAWSEGGGPPRWSCGSWARCPASCGWSRAVFMRDAQRLLPDKSHPAPLGRGPAFAPAGAETGRSSRGAWQLCVVGQRPVSERAGAPGPRSAGPSAVWGGGSSSADRRPRAKHSPPWDSQVQGLTKPRSGGDAALGAIWEQPWLRQGRRLPGARGCLRGAWRLRASRGQPWSASTGP